MCVVLAAVTDNKEAILDFGIGSFDSELVLEYHCGISLWNIIVEHIGNH